ncbi:MAG: hypothetical protein B7X06_03520, partial [Verrucomicrobia bacterium 21-51-4]
MKYVYLSLICLFLAPVSWGQLTILGVDTTKPSPDMKDPLAASEAAYIPGQTEDSIRRGPFTPE